MNILLIALLAVVFLVILPLVAATSIIFVKLLTRPKDAPRERVCSFPEEAEYMGMYTAAEEWTEAHKACRTDVQIQNDGLNLYGEYYDFGCKRAVIILPGRTETCRYSCYFAEPYRVSGYNVLVVDGRSHGLSDGRVNSLGFREYRDLLLWTRLVHDRFGNEQVLYHGVCIGASTALTACASKDCPDYVSGMVSEGMYWNFFLTTKNHMKDSHRPLFPFLYILMGYIRVFCGGSAVFDGPCRRIRDMRKPILFLHSRKDIFSEPEYAQRLFDMCPSENKQLVWFDKGGHSRVRINNVLKYDQEICRFVGELCPAVKE